MTSTRSLLFRLEHPEIDGGRDLPGNADHLMDSVCRHLQVMLNTRQGNAPTVPDYGTTDYSDLFRGYQSAAQIQDDIRRSIEKYEPRLRDVQVFFRQSENEPFTLHFDITGNLQLSDRDKPTVFRSTIGANGEVRVARGD